MSLALFLNAVTTFYALFYLMMPSHGPRFVSSSMWMALGVR